MHFVPFLRLSTSRFLPNLRLIKWAVRYNSESVKFWHSTAENGSLFLWNSPVTRIGDKSTSLWMALQLNSQRRMAESSADLLRRRVSESLAKIWGKWSSWHPDPMDRLTQETPRSPWIRCSNWRKRWRRIDEFKVTVKIFLRLRKEQVATIKILCWNNEYLAKS